MPAAVKSNTRMIFGGNLSAHSGWRVIRPKFSSSTRATRADADKVHSAVIPAFACVNARSAPEAGRVKQPKATMQIEGTDVGEVRELIAELENHGFVNCGGKGSHRNFTHPRVARPVRVSDEIGSVQPR
jgi:hypothetical protein